MIPIEMVHAFQPVSELSELDSRLRAIEHARGGDNTPLSSAEMLSEAMQYNINGCIWSFRRFGQFIRENAKLDPPQPGQLKTILDGSFEAHVLIDHFLSSARRVQDLVTGYMSKALRVSFSSSMDDVAKKAMKEADAKRLKVSDALRRVITEYWQANGATLRDYRVLLQHHGQIASDCRYFAHPLGGLSFFCALPKNPDQRRAGALSWEPAIDAYPYLRSELAALLLFVRRVACLLLEEVPFEESLGRVVTFKAALYPDQVGSSLPEENDFDALLKEIENELPRK